MPDNTSQPIDPAIVAEITDCFTRQGVSGLAYRDSFIYADGWYSLSQYGYIMSDRFDTRQAAEAYTIEYYAEHMNLIRQ